MSNHLLYQDHSAVLTSEVLALRGFTKILGRARRVPLDQIVSFRVRQRSEFPDEQLPRWGLNEQGVWYTRDRHRWRCRATIELKFATREPVGFSPAHASRLRDLLVGLGVSEQ